MVLIKLTNAIIHKSWSKHVQFSTILGWYERNVGWNERMPTVLFFSWIGVNRPKSKQTICTVCTQLFTLQYRDLRCSQFSLVVCRSNTLVPNRSLIWFCICILYETFIASHINKHNNYTLNLNNNNNIIEACSKFGWAAS